MSENLLAKAIALVATEFQHKTDRAGKPYISHCLRVMNNVDQRDKELMCIAVLHDLLEDFPDQYNIPVLMVKGFSMRIINAIDLLTHKPDYSYDEYIKKISTNRDATLVKLADLKDNLDITRLKGLRKTDFERMEKYHKAFVYLSDLYK